MSVLNALRMNTETKEIRLGIGATGAFKVKIVGSVVFNITDDKAVFAIGKESTSRVGREMVYTYEKIKTVNLPIKGNTTDGFYVDVEIANEDTRTLNAGTYVWNLTLVQDAEEDESGEIITDERTDGVYPIFTANSQPKFILEGVADVV